MYTSENIKRIIYLKYYKKRGVSSRDTLESCDKIVDNEEAMGLNHENTTIITSTINTQVVKNKVYIDSQTNKIQEAMGNNDGISTKQ